MRYCKPGLSTAFEIRLEPIVYLFVVPPIGTRPELFILERSHYELLRTGRIHFFSNNLHDVIQGAKSERQVGIHARHFLMDEARAYQELRVL